MRVQGSSLKLVIRNVVIRFTGGVKRQDELSKATYNNRMAIGLFVERTASRK